MKQKIYNELVKIIDKNIEHRKEGMEILHRYIWLETAIESLIDYPKLRDDDG